MKQVLERRYAGQTKTAMAKFEIAVTSAEMKRTENNPLQVSYLIDELRLALEEIRVLNPLQVLDPIKI